MGMVDMFIFYPRIVGEVGDKWNAGVISWNLQYNTQLYNYSLNHANPHLYYLCNI